MKEEFIKKLLPVVEGFADEILASFGDIEKIRVDVQQKEALYQDLVNQKEKELSQIRIRKSAEKEDLDRRITELEEAKDESIRSAKSYKTLTDEMSRKRDETENTLAQSKIELARAKDVRSQADKEKEDAEKLRKDYELKISSLKVDADKNSKDKKYIDDHKVKLAVREADVFMNEARNEATSKELRDLNIRVKADRKEVDRLIKRNSLEKKMEENQ